MPMSKMSYVCMLSCDVLVSEGDETGSLAALRQWGTAATDGLQSDRVQNNR